VREVVSDKVTLLVTDEWVGYRGLDREYPHEVIRHTHEQYVVGAIHTNTIEGFWSLFKRGIVGTFHKMSETYMPLYVNEFEFRHNTKGEPDPFGLLIASC
jgi:ISXO2-like transposase domain